MSESAKFQTKVILKKWSAEQTQTVSMFHNGMHPNDLTPAHFEELKMQPVEIIEVDHTNDTVTHEGKTYSIDEWNKTHGA